MGPEERHVVLVIVRIRQLNKVCQRKTHTQDEHSRLYPGGFDNISSDFNQTSDTVVFPRRGAVQLLKDIITCGRWRLVSYESRS